MITIDLSPEAEMRLSEYAAMRGQNIADSARLIVEKTVFAPSEDEDETLTPAEHEYIVRAVLEARASEKAGRFRPLSEFAEEMRAKYKFPMPLDGEEEAA